MPAASFDAKTGKLKTDGGDLREYGSSLTIEELDPPAPGKQPRIVVLLGPALPFMGAEWGFENNLVTTWYPGNATEATQQNLGPKELPSTWEGEWKRTLMGKAPSVFYDETGEKQQIQRPFVMRDIIEDIGRTGVRLRVTWSVYGQSVSGSVLGNGDLVEDNMEIVREGRIKSARFPHDRHTDIRWSIEFHWMGRGGRQDKVADVRGDTDLSAAADSLIASAAATDLAFDSKIRSIKSAIHKSSNHLTLGQIEAFANAPTALATKYTRKLQQTVSDFKRVGDIAKTIASQPTAVANVIVDFARNTTAVANNFVDQMSRIPIEQQTTKEKVSALTRAHKYFGNTTDKAVKNAREGQKLDARVRQITAKQANRGTFSVRETATVRAGEILAIYICKQGDTPQTVSQKFYRSPDHGQEILRANKLSWYTPTFGKGKIIVVPALVNAPRAV